MKSNYTSARPCLLRTAFGLGCILASGAISPAFGAIKTWDGDASDNILGTPANWDLNTAPVAGDTMTWNGTPAGALSLVYSSAVFGGAPPLNLDVTAAQTGSLTIDTGLNTSSIRINNITLAAGSGAFTLGNGADLFNITLGNVPANHTWTNNSSNVATIETEVDTGLGGAGSHAIVFGGSGNWLYKAPYINSNGGTNLSLYKGGAGELTLAGGGDLRPGANINGGTIYSAILKEGVTRITAGTYSNNNAEFVVGGLDTSAGTDTQLIMDAGSITGVGWMSVGRGNGDGTASSDIVLNNGSILSSANLSMGFNAGNGATKPKGSITLNGTSVQTVTTNNFFVAESPGSVMSVTLNGSSTLNSLEMRIGIGNAGAIGKLNVNDTALLTSTGDARIGYGDGTGELNITGGTVNLSSLTAARGTGAGSLATGTINVTGGVLTSTNDMVLGYAGANNLGKLVIDGGTVNEGTTALKWLSVRFA